MAATTAPFLPGADVSFDDPADVAAAPPADRKIKYYRNPMGLPDVSPTPKKDSMGMDYIPVYEGEDSDDGSVKLSPGKIQRTGVKSEPAAPARDPHDDPRPRHHPARRAARLRDRDALRKLCPEGCRRHHGRARRQGPAADGNLQSGDLVGGRRIHLDPQFQGHRRRRGLRQGLAPAADESRRAGSGHRRHGEGPQRSDRDRMDVAARRHRSRTQRHRRHARPTRRRSCSGSPITGWCGRSSMSPSAIWERSPWASARSCARGVFPGGSFRERST